MVPEVTDSAIGEREVTQLAALNETLRNDYSDDCQKGVDRWNRSISDAGVDFEMRLPSIGFNRNVGTFAGHRVPPDGKLISEAEWQANVGRWLPTESDRAHVQSLMVGVTEPGKMAGWVAAPTTGIHQQPVDFEYVKI
jgi:benzoyl-CoA 2,3-dioxygenase component B